MQIEDFDYELPPELIAQHPSQERTASRLLHVDAGSGAIEDRMFRELPALVRPDDVVVFNDTRVIKARLRGGKETGGVIEVLIERILDPHHALAQIRASHAPREGSKLLLSEGLRATVLERRGPFYRVRFDDTREIFALLELHGSTPLPPYIARVPDKHDEDRYQTVYARDPGAVAAPTAGLHFDRGMIGDVKATGAEVAWVTLHVGAGTFQPVRNPDVRSHTMHSEWFRIPQATVDAIRTAKERGGRVLAVGTTTLRALETACPDGELQAGSGETNLFILPGYRFKVVECLVTNFHLPRSTLLMLVAAFGGLETIRAAYRHAVQERYRFYSYGDAMLIERGES
ncbi:MAG: tRNA preQ1(34) S-adenosylmethionine ribosyltransferase-isomerase QueA [Burkholderiales bacterium]